MKYSNFATFSGIVKTKTGIIQMETNCLTKLILLRAENALSSASSETKQL